MKKHRMFHFKHFSLYHENSALKISTDAVLLAAITPVSGVRKLLDIGSGCGVIAFCLAWKMRQANKGEHALQKVTGIDIDAASVEEARKNLGFFPKDRQQTIDFQHGSIQKFAQDKQGKYDLIVSNPPFFVHSLKPSTSKKNISKHNDSLPYEDLRDAVCQLLEPGGTFYLILPANESEVFNQTVQNQLFIHYRLLIQPTPTKPINRIITGYRLSPAEEACHTEQLCLHKPDGSTSEQYRRLTKEFLIGPVEN